MGVGAIAAIVLVVFARGRSSRQIALPPAIPTPNEPTKTSEPEVTLPALRHVKAQDIPGVASAYRFGADVSVNWQIEAVPATEAINLYDPAAAGPSNLDKSQIFIRHFRANDFQTLQTVTIHSREGTTIDGRPAVRYDIEKKPAVAQFANQPSWRSERHIVTDVRVSDTNPSVFYVIAKRPDFDEGVYRQFLQGFKVSTDQAGLIEPIGEFRSRITKKPFGILITRENSPVQPERFSGFHSGVDVEYTDKLDVDIPVRAIAPGTVVHSGRAAGYGGVLVISHQIGSASTLALYGHLDPSSLPKVGSEISAGQRIGILGEGGTTETDGERKHLHFALIKGQSVNLKGYVKTKSELSGWEDPLAFF